MASNEIQLVYSTAPSLDVARVLSKALLAERLAACVNIFPGMTAMYIWEGKMEEADEVGILIKTTLAHWERLKSRVQELHPYETPCLIRVAADQVVESYGRWLRSSMDEESG